MVPVTRSTWRSRLSSASNSPMMRSRMARVPSGTGAGSTFASSTRCRAQSLGRRVGEAFPYDREATCLVTALPDEMAPPQRALENARLLHHRQFGKDCRDIFAPGLGGKAPEIVFGYLNHAAAPVALAPVTARRAVRSQLATAR